MEKGVLRRRDLLQLTAAAAGAYALGGLQAWPALAAPANTLTVGTWGGIWERAFKEAITPGFQRETNAQVTFDISSSQERVAKIRAQRSNQSMDIAMLTPEAMVFAMEEGLLEPIDTSVVTNLQDIDPRFRDIFRKNDRYYAAGVSWSATGILWRKDLVPFEVRTWKDLWRPELRGKISIQNMPTLGAASFLLTSSITHGGTQHNVEPGWKALKELKPNIKFFFTLSSAVLNQLASGEIWAAVTIAGQGLPYVDRNVRITIPNEGTTYSVQAMSVAVNAPNRSLAHRFMNYCLSPEQEVAWARITSVAPANRKVRLDIRTKMQLVENEATIRKLWSIDFLNMAKRMEEWTERWQREIT
jgi:putative spermidine/putrescine transport system substrate-binding protein